MQCGFDDCSINDPFEEESAPAAGPHSSVLPKPVNNKLSFPPIPPNNECPYCGDVIEFQSSAKSRLWRSHVIKNLEPFICVFARCLEADSGHHEHRTDPLTFGTSYAWLNHMQNARKNIWECRAPSHKNKTITFDQKTQYWEHCINEHNVPEKHVVLLSGAARRPVHDTVLDCPFCGAFPTPDRDCSLDAGVFSSEALQSHVAAHLKDIALPTLQRLPLPSDADGSAENVNRDQYRPLEADGSGNTVNCPASVDSVLDDISLCLQDDDDEAIDGNLNHVEETLGALYMWCADGDLELRSKNSVDRTALHYASMEQSRSPAIPDASQAERDIASL
ncbi:hypothetical protein BDW74DRAFT_174496 [Aspergillus multicolor]|uniref:uncharacterized protein n=1 Tax=Aspergillus multicolor TaxID=41759 RepID=UPI003CCE2DC1